MQYLPNDIILKYNDNTLEDVRKAFDLDKPRVMANKIHILEEWVMQQNHFTKRIFDKRYLEMTIIASKGSIQRAKSRLDRACTVRTLIPDIFGIHDIRHFFKTDVRMVKSVVLPKMTRSNERVYINKDTGAKFDADSYTHNTFPNYVRSLTFFGEYIRRHDYAANYYVVIDLMDADLIAVAKAMTIQPSRDLAAYLLEGCGFRVKAIYFISSSVLIEAIISIFKRVLTAKLIKRIHVLKNRECLKNIFDKKILPEDYGGEEKSMDELHEAWLDVLTSEDHIQYLKEVLSARTDESKRQGLVFIEEYLGMPGSFAKLDVD